MNSTVEKRHYEINKLLGKTPSEIKADAAKEMFWNKFNSIKNSVNSKKIAKMELIFIIRKNNYHKMFYINK